MAEASEESKGRLVLNVDSNLSFIESLLPDVQQMKEVMDKLKCSIEAVVDGIN